MCSKPPHVKLFAAVEEENLSSVEAILSKGSVDLGFQHHDFGGQTVLHRAARHLDAGILKALLKAGADPLVVSQDGKTALMTAVYFGNVQAVKTIIEIGINDLLGMIDDSRANAFHYGSQKGRAEILTLLLNVCPGDAQNFVNACDAGNNTPLHKAALGGHNSAIRVLLDHGADPAAKNFDNMTAAECCAFAKPDGYESCVEMLQSKK